MDFRTVVSYYGLVKEVIMLGTVKRALIQVWICLVSFLDLGLEDNLHTEKVVCLES